MTSLGEGGEARQPESGNVGGRRIEGHGDVEILRAAVGVYQE
jgi:hypothetical protein